VILLSSPKYWQLTAIGLNNWRSKKTGYCSPIATPGLPYGLPWRWWLHRSWRISRIAFGYWYERRYVRRSSICRSLLIPQKRILVPGTTLLGASRNALSVFSDHTIPESFIAGEYL
jgi:hypothetical protein